MTKGTSPVQVIRHLSFTCLGDNLDSLKGLHPAAGGPRPIPVGRGPGDVGTSKFCNSSSLKASDKSLNISIWTLSFLNGLNCFSFDKIKAATASSSSIVSLLLVVRDVRNSLSAVTAASVKAYIHYVKTSAIFSVFVIFFHFRTLMPAFFPSCGKMLRWDQSYFVIFFFLASK